MSVVKNKDNYIVVGQGAIIDTSLKSHANDPFVVKKAEAAEIAVRKLVFPEIKNK